MDQSKLLQYLVSTLEALEIPYMISGSQASIYYGEPRFTNDIDMVAEVRLPHVAGLITRFPFPEFYLDEDAIRQAIMQHSQFNIIHPASGLKVDVIIPKATSYDQIQFQRRQRVPLVPGQDAYFARPEDIILYKMIYYREGQSEKHLRDIASMLRISGDDIDREYIGGWASRLKVGEIWQAIFKKLGE